MGCHSILQGIFLIQGLPHCRQILYHLSHQGRPESESCSVMSDSLRPRGLYSPWNFPGQNTGVGSLSLLQGIFPTQESNKPRSPTLQADSLPAEPPGKPKNPGVGKHIPSLGDLPNPRIKPGSPALQVDSLPTEPPGKPEHTGLGSLSLLEGIFPTQELKQGLLHCSRILYQLSYQGNPRLIVAKLFCVKPS